MALRVLHVLHHIFHYPCGYRTRSEAVLHCQREHGIETMVLTSSDHEHGCELADPPGTNVLRTAAYFGTTRPGIRECRLLMRLLRHLSKAVTRLQPDLIHAHSPMLVALPALLTARRRNLPFVYEVRDLWENAAVDLGALSRHSLRFRVARALDGFILRQADAVVVICEEMRKDVTSRGVRADRVFVVPNGVHLDSLRVEASSASRQRWGLPPEHVIGYVGSLQPYEGLDLLVDSLPAILDQLPSARLLIVGDGTHEHRLRALVRERNLDDHVTFAGRVPHSDVSGAYAACDLLVYPRWLTDTTRLTTALKPLEAMALGKAVLASDVPAMLELVQSEITGLLFPSGDARQLAARCVELLRDPALRARLGTAAREWVLRERRWDASQYEEAYKTALGVDRRRHAIDLLGAIR